MEVAGVEETDRVDVIGFWASQIKSVWFLLPNGIVHAEWSPRLIFLYLEISFLIGLRFILIIKPKVFPFVNHVAKTPARTKEISALSCSITNESI